MGESLRGLVWVCQSQRGFGAPCTPPGYKGVCLQMASSAQIIPIIHLLWSKFGGDRNPSVSLHFRPTQGPLWDHSLEVVLGMMLGSEQSHIWVWTGRRQKKSQGCAGED